MITKSHFEKLHQIKVLTWEFEQLTGSQVQITGTVGEVEACYRLKMELETNPANPGYDAIDQDGKKVQIKACRMKEKTNPSSLVGKFVNSKKENSHDPMEKKLGDFDYAILVLLTEEYDLAIMAKFKKKELVSHLEALEMKRKQRGKGAKYRISIGTFIKLAKKNGELLFPNTKYRGKNLLLKKILKEI